MKTLTSLLVAAAIAVTGALSLGAFVSFKSDSNAPLSLVKGQVASEFEKHYNEELFSTDFSTHTWIALQYLLFGEGKAGLVVGEDGWLFTDEEFKSYENVNDRLDQRYQEITHISSYLSSKGIPLVFVLVPAKARVYSEFTGADEPASYFSALYSQTLATLVEAGLKAPSIVSAFDSKKGESLFLRTDTHWTPKGAEICATTIADFIHSNMKIDTDILGKTQFSTRLEDSLIHKGDLLNYLPLGVYEKWLGPEPDTLEVMITEKVSQSMGINDLFAEEEVEVVLVGSSYSANRLWNFEGALKKSLGADIINYADEGRGPMLPMLEYLASDDFKHSPPSLVIWEFPERYLPVEYETAQYLEKIKGFNKNNIHLANK